MSIFSYFLNKFTSKNERYSSVEDGEGDFDRYSSLLKEATRLKKEGNLKSAIKTIDEALLLQKNNNSVYKKSFYLQLDNQFDEAWKTMSEYNEDMNVKILESIDWYTLKNAFYEYSDSSESLIKLLKKEKKNKELIYYLPGGEYNNLLVRLTYPTTKLKDVAFQIENTSLSEKIKLKKSENFDLSSFDSQYKKIVLSYKNEFKALHEHSQKSDFMYYYDNAPSGLSEEALKEFDKITREADKSIKENEEKAFKILKNIWSKGIKLNDDCYKKVVF